MTFTDAVKSLKTGYAAKTPAMRGYLKRVDSTKGDNDTWDSQYQLIFVESVNSNDGDNASSYAFTVTTTNSVQTITGPSTGLTLDSLLFGYLLGTDWITMTTALAEANNSSAASRW